MNYRSCAIACAALAVWIVSVRAAEKDFWQSKPFTEWSEKEVEKLLKNSPWSRPISISTGPIGGGAGSRGSRGGGGGIPRGGAIGVEDGEVGAGRGMPGDTGPRTMELVATWYSQPVRQAMARSITLHNPGAPKEELEKLLNYPETEYFDILIIGWRGFRGDPEKEIEKLRQETCLEKKNKEKIGLADVIIPQRRGQALALLFPKQVDGKPSITLEDREVTLRTRVGNSTVRARFKLADMVVEGEPAL